MDIAKISNRFVTKRLTEENAEQIYELELGNPMYFEYCPPKASIASVLENMQALPPNMTYDDKLYIGFLLDDKLVAVMDLILHYPTDDTAFVGFFMMNHEFQRTEIGSQIVSEVLLFLKKESFSYVRLGYMKGNEQSRQFWLKNGFAPTGGETNNGQGIVVVMQKPL